MAAPSISTYILSNSSHYYGSEGGAAVMTSPSDSVTKVSAIISQTSGGAAIETVETTVKTSSDLYADRWALTWPTAGITASPYYVRMWATNSDGDGAVREVAPYIFFPPSVSVTSPANGSTLTDSSVTMAWTATDDYGISYQRASVSHDGTELWGAEVEGNSIAVPSSVVFEDGESYSFSVTARNGKGMEATATNTASFSFVAPSVPALVIAEGDGKSASITVTDSSYTESGTVLEASSAMMDSLTIQGLSVQDGTPTPSAPVAIESVKDGNLLLIGDAYLLTDFAMLRASVVDGMLRVTPTGSAGYGKAVVDYLDYADYGSATFDISFECRLADVTTSYTNVNGMRVYYGFSAAGRETETFSATYDRYGYTALSSPAPTSDWQTYSVTVTTASMTSGTASALTAGSNFSVEPYISGSNKPMEFRNIRVCVGGVLLWTADELMEQADDPVISEVPTNDPAYWMVSSGGNGVGSVETVTGPAGEQARALRITGNTSGNRDLAKAVPAFMDDWNGSAWVGRMFMFSCWARGIGGGCTMQMRTYGIDAGSSAEQTHTASRSAPIGESWTRIVYMFSLSTALNADEVTVKLLVGITGAGSIEFVHPSVSHVDTLDATPIPATLRSLPDGTHDEWVSGESADTLVQRVGETMQAVTDGVTGTVGVDVLSSTGEIANGAQVLYKLATPVTTTLAHVNLPYVDGSAWVDAEVTPQIEATFRPVDFPDQPAADSVDVVRVNADGSTWTVASNLTMGDTVTDPLPPLGVDAVYKAVGKTSAGGMSEKLYMHGIPTTGWVLNFGDAAQETVEFIYNPQATMTLAQGGESYHFADGGMGGGLPVFYPTTDRDASGTLAFDTVLYGDSDRLLDLCRRYPVAWLRDPFGHRWRAHVRPSVSHGVGQVWPVTIAWDAVRFEEV